MSASHQRYEILIPLSFNDGTSVPESLAAETPMELRQHFGAVSAETQTIIGQWEHAGDMSRDQHLRLEAGDRAGEDRFI